MATLTTKHGDEFIVDDEDVALVGNFSWKLDKDGYIYRKTTVAGKKGRSVRLHRVIMKATNPAVIIDHINGNKLDNRKENLREVTKKQNSENRIKDAGTSSVFRGVTWSKATHKWQAAIKMDDKNLYLGLFNNEHEAAHAYNKKAVELFGEFARLNPVGYGSLSATAGAA